MLKWGCGEQVYEGGRLVGVILGGILVGVILGVVNRCMKVGVGCLCRC